MTTADAHILAPGLAPTPFTAAEIRAGCPVGRVSIVRTPDGLGSIRFASDDEEGAWIEETALDERGEAAGPVERERSTWLELQEHAAFPAESTSIDRAELNGPLGTLPCLRYTVRRGEAVLVFWFAVDLPGMPIRVERTEGGETRTTLEVVAVSGLPGR
ncbi:hypothetical protein ASF88_00090 [Leifsonia sp. Leaf336]|uniref:hypothetical protein n=1 Tax=Leifsonia sp. Leaf336 TaxID=1736341 RepID=UPI0006F56F22|nr:hypothetical protein [Leifsonia sp. Leaf336]KQR53342.1 hypothetical protein ASF88_00090 [Leifsonia sp. Leaf336]